MPQIVVRNLEASLIEALKDRARRNGRPLQAELRIVLQQAADAKTYAGGEWTPETLAAVDRVRAMYAGRTFSDSTELLRANRDGAEDLS